jgi:hypothetical protein
MLRYRKATGLWNWFAILYPKRGGPNWDETKLIRALGPAARYARLFQKRRQFHSRLVDLQGCKARSDRG